MKNLPMLFSSPFTTIKEKAFRLRYVGSVNPLPGQMLSEMSDRLEELDRTLVRTIIMDRAFMSIGS